MAVVIPPELIAPDSFRLPSHPDVTFRRPLELNTVAQLRDLGTRIGLSFASRTTKINMAGELEHCISHRPIDITLALYPVLQNMDAEHITTFEQCLWVRNRLDGLWPQDRDETIHFKIMRERLRSLERGFESVRKQAEADAEREREVAEEPPNWMSYVKQRAPRAAHWRITLLEGCEGHDGYCSDAGPLEVREWDTDEVFLPIHDTDSDITWTSKNLMAKRTWSEPCECSRAGGSGVCGARARVELRGFERVEVAPPSSSS